MKLYTTTGDRGDTSLRDGTRVPKSHPRVKATGQLDELNAVLGWCRSAPQADAFAERIEAIQRTLFALGAELSAPSDAAGVGPDEARLLERWIDEACGETAPLRNFVLPGGTELACRLHLARTRCRAAERSVVALRETGPVPGDVFVYLNRLSDLLFAWARRANQSTGCPDTIWRAED